VPKTITLENRRADRKKRVLCAREESTIIRDLEREEGSAATRKTRARRVPCPIHFKSRWIENRGKGAALSISTRTGLDGSEKEKAGAAELEETIRRPLFNLPGLLEQSTSERRKKITVLSTRPIIKSLGNSTRLPKTVRRKKKKSVQ